MMLPDFRVRQRDYLLEISRALTQELDLAKLLARILRISIEMLAGQAGIIALKQQEGWQVAAAHGIPGAFLSYVTPLLAEENVRVLRGSVASGELVTDPRDTHGIPFLWTDRDTPGDMRGPV